MNPADASAEEAALGFLDAFAAFDAQKAMTYVTDEADLRELIDAQVPANAEGLSLRLSRLKAVGYEQTVTSCEAAAFGSDTSVVCDFDFHALGSDQIGRGPFSDSSFVFTVRDGAIVRASLRWNLDKFVPADVGALRGVGLLDVPEGRRRHVPGRNALAPSGSRRSRSGSGSGTLASTWRK